MGGAAHMASMNPILQNNRKLLRKISVFKKDRSFMSNRKAYLKATKEDVDIKKTKLLYLSLADATEPQNFKIN